LRQIGTLPKTLDAKVFADYLLTLGMKARLDEQPDGWNVWIYNEDHVERGSDELRNFLSRPEDPRYREAVESALAIRRQEQQLDQQFRKNYRDAYDLWGYPGLRRRPLTVALVAISLVVFVLHDSPRRERAVEQKLCFSTSYVDLEGVTHSNGLNDILHGQVWRLLTPIFLHFGIWHLVFNAFALGSFGTVVELRRGTLRMLAIVLVAAVASNLGQYLYMERADPGRQQIFGGLSGVICALFGYVWMKSLYQPEQGMILHPNTVIFVLFYLALCMTPLMGPIANAAHVVGVVVGVTFGVLRF
jgi:GlpG protein